MSMRKETVITLNQNEIKEILLEKFGGEQVNFEWIKCEENGIKEKCLFAEITISSEATF